MKELHSMRWITSKLSTKISYQTFTQQISIKLIKVKDFYSWKHRECLGMKSKLLLFSQEVSLYREASKIFWKRLEMTSFNLVSSGSNSGPSRGCLKLSSGPLNVRPENILRMSRPLRYHLNLLSNPQFQTSHCSLTNHFHCLSQTINSMCFKYLFLDVLNWGLTKLIIQLRSSNHEMR